MIPILELLAHRAWNPPIPDSHSCVLELLAHRALPDCSLRSRRPLQIPNFRPKAEFSQTSSRSRCRKPRTGRKFDSVGSLVTCCTWSCSTACLTTRSLRRPETQVAAALAQHRELRAAYGSV